MRNNHQPVYANAYVMPDGRVRIRRYHWFEQCGPWGEQFYNVQHSYRPHNIGHGYTKKEALAHLSGLDKIYGRYWPDKLTYASDEELQRILQSGRQH